MHPIDIVHNKIIAGFVLNLYGEWVPRGTALQEKQQLINRVCAGDVELNGKWISLQSVRRTWETQKNDAQKRSADSVEDKKIQKKIIKTSAGVRKKVSDQNESDTKVIPKNVAPYSHESARVRSVYFTLKNTIQINPEIILTISETEQQSNKVCVFAIDGYVDQSNCKAIQGELIDRVNDSIRFFIFDFSRTTLISSAGWGMLAALKGQLSKIQGDLMIVFMTKEIEESFRLLQFGAVLKACMSYEECLHHIKNLMKKNMTERAAIQNEQLTSQSGEVLPQDMPLQEKVRAIIAHYGPVPVGKIRSILKQQEFGEEMIGLFKLRMALREMNLDTEEKRKRFYRSC